MAEKPNPIQKHKKIFFSNLNGVRAFAALLVVVSHTELHKANFHLDKLVCKSLLGFGSVGVSIFFSLSGFLITYLLLEEKKNFTKINFSDFYVRRILRIWPLYFLVIIFGFFIYPGVSSVKPIWLSIFFLPNVAFILSLLPAIVDPIWSIGIEEQFYIFHPHFFRIKKTQHILYALILFVVFFFVAFAIVKHIFRAHPDNIIGNDIFYFARYDDMMIGGIVALIYFNTKNKTFDFKLQPLFNLLFNKYVQMALFVVFFFLIWLCGTHTVPQGDVALSIIAAFIIVNLCENDTSIFSLNYKGFQFTGRVSYGIYLLHKFPMFLVLYLVSTYMAGSSPLLQNVAIYTGTGVAVVSLAAASYYGYERNFLLIKKKFQKVPNNVV